MVTKKIFPLTELTMIKAMALVIAGGPQQKNKLTIDVAERSKVCHA